MIVDIVPLINRWETFKKTPDDFSTFNQICVPSFGHHMEYPDEGYFPVGRTISINECKKLHRYKIIEQFGDAVFEYFAVSFHKLPLNDIHKCKHELIPLSVIEHNVKTRNSVKSYIIRGIETVLYEVMSYPTKIDRTTSRSAYLSELEVTEEKYLFPISETIGILPTKSTIPIYDLLPASDHKDMQRFFNLGPVLSELRWDDFSLFMPHISSIACVSSWVVPKAATAITFNVLCSGDQEVRQLVPHLGPGYGTQRYARNIPKLDFDKEIRTSTDGMEVWYDVLKYIEQLPYTEFVLTGTLNKWGIYTTNAIYDQEPRAQSGNYEDRKNPITKIWLQLIDLSRSLYSKCPISSIHVERSWNDDVYITYVYENKEKLTYYFDFMLLALGSRQLLEDYESSWFFPLHY